MTKAEKYVLTKIELDKLWNELSADDRREAEAGLRWLAFQTGGGTPPKRRGRPKGAANKPKVVNGVESPAIPPAA